MSKKIGILDPEAPNDEARLDGNEEPLNFSDPAAVAAFPGVALLTPALFVHYAKEQDASDKENPPDDGKKTVEQHALATGDVRGAYVNPLLAGARHLNHWAVGTRLTAAEYAEGLKAGGEVAIGGPQPKPKTTVLVPDNREHSPAFSKK